MSPDRGEACNHGIADVASFMRLLQSELTMKETVDAYETEMVTRCGPAVMMSRQASLDAHDFTSISENSPLIAKRIIVADKR